MLYPYFQPEPAAHEPGAAGGTDPDRSWAHQVPYRPRQAGPPYQAGSAPYDLQTYWGSNYWWRDIPGRNICILFSLFFIRTSSLTLIRMAIKHCVTVRLGIICHFQLTNRKLGGLPVRAPLRCAPVGCVGVIYDSQPAKIHKNTTTNRWKLLLFDWKIA